MIGFESADVPQGEYIRQAVEIARGAGGEIDDDAIRIDDGSGRATGREGAVGAWRDAFIGVNAGVGVFAAIRVGADVGRDATLAVAQPIRCRPDFLK